MPSTTITKLVILFVLGCVVGVGVHTFYYAKGASYLTDNPEACMNCHVMQEQFNGWIKSSHRAVAVCNDCHTPAGFVAKYATKALNGWHHSLAFTTGNFPDNIQITERNRDITERSCRKCHADFVHAIDTSLGGEPISCLRCHNSVGHRQ
jgi:cytochrome c nitrite reductase small subunit